METPPQGYRKSVRICLVNASKKGGADGWEDLRFAAMRELREETGVTSAEFLAEVGLFLMNVDYLTCTL
ncbi:hypothetical protein GH714_037699 [Hevea brasiliensis]|uniref:Uncharacterized protein n=1 Tax=Hevea brasiliensis TaxID=3981 RepID=A0A6A6KLK0_HEVBR|nr:hypothetical protein GH714_037699 [Hevea brasiliensis]